MVRWEGELDKRGRKGKEKMRRKTGNRAFINKEGKKG